MFFWRRFHNQVAPAELSLAPYPFFTTDCLLNWTPLRFAYSRAPHPPQIQSPPFFLAAERPRRASFAHRQAARAA